jgi:transcriptional regulator with XRE-family HTH domain
MFAYTVPPGLANVTLEKFADRLNVVLRLDGYVSLAARVARLAIAFDIHPSTTRRWLSGRQSPAVFRVKYWRGAAALDAPFLWLMHGESALQPWTFTKLAQMTERHAVIVGKWNEWHSYRFYQRLTPVERGKILRMDLRLRNDDPKALRLCAAHQAGQITWLQLLETM